MLLSPSNKAQQTANQAAQKQQLAEQQQKNQLRPNTPTTNTSTGGMPMGGGANNARQPQPAQPSYGKSNRQSLRVALDPTQIQAQGGASGNQPGARTSQWGVKPTDTPPNASPLNSNDNKTGRTVSPPTNAQSPSSNPNLHGTPRPTQPGAQPTSHTQPVQRTTVPIQPMRTTPIRTIPVQPIKQQPQKKAPEKKGFFSFGKKKKKEGTFFSLLSIVQLAYSVRKRNANLLTIQLPTNLPRRLQFHHRYAKLL
jgi:hypothetical protein